MKLLLDTHAILWLISDDARLGNVPRKYLECADELYWSTASLWEISIKLSLDRPDFTLGAGWARLIPEEMRRNGIQRIGIEAVHCEEVSRLPWHHRDPFDRMLVAQAKTEKISILSRDEALDDYGVERYWSAFKH